MNLKKLRQLIGDKQRSLVKNNAELLSRGKMDEYHNNCFILKGMDYVMEKLRRVDS